VSLRVRLVLTTAAVALIALAVAGVATYSAFSRAQLRQIDDSLQRAHEPIEQALSSDDDGDNVIERAASGTFVALRDPSGDTQLVVPLREPGREPATVDLTSFEDVSWPTTRGPDADPAVYRTADVTGSDDQLRLRISLLDDGSVLFVGQPLHDTEQSRRQLLVIELVVMASALVVAVAVGWVLVGAGLRPLRRVEGTALAVAGGRLDVRAPGADDRTEVGRLAAALNTMLDRIHESFDERDATEAALRNSQQRMRRFVADVSHELRTPLAAVSAYAELLERGARTRPDVDRAIHGIAVESGRMNELVEELLLLARLDEGRPLEQVTVDLAALLVDAARTARTVAPDHPVALSISEVVTVTGDATRLRQVVDNLLANVRTHTPPGTITSITLTTNGDEAVVVVADDGPGMQPVDAERMFERFYRTDSSRSRQTGGAGLGMPIVAAIVAAHGGNVHVDTAPGAGLRVTVSIPRLASPIVSAEDDDE
jgi:two-component system, OmpR family, sensor kinase